MRHRHHFATFLIALASTAVLAWGFSPGCVTNPETGEVEIHWPSVAVEVGLVADDIRDAASIAEPGLSETLFGLADAAEQVSVVIGSGPPDPDTLELIDALLGRVDAAWEAVSGDQAPADIRVAVLLLRSALRRVRAYA